MSSGQTNLGGILASERLSRNTKRYCAEWLFRAYEGEFTFDECLSMVARAYALPIENARLIRVEKEHKYSTDKVSRLWGDVIPS